MLDNKGSRIEKLKSLAVILADAINTCEDQKTLPQLARQYRETIREIEEIEGGGIPDDEIGDILANREENGKPGAVRKNRAKV